MSCTMAMSPSTSVSTSTSTSTSTNTASTAMAIPRSLAPASSMTPSPSTSPVPFSSSVSCSPPLLLSRTVLEWPAPDPSTSPRPSSASASLLQVALTAPGPHTAVFKFKTNAPQLYRVKPSAGSVAPGASVMVLVQCADVSLMRGHGTDNLLLQMCFDLSSDPTTTLSQADAAQLIRSLDRTQIVEQVLSCTLRRHSTGTLGVGSHPPTPRATSPVSPPANLIPSPVLSTTELRRSSFSSVHEHPLDAVHDTRSLSPSPHPLPSPPSPPPQGPSSPSSTPLATSPPLRTKPRQRRTSTTTASPILRTTLLSNAASPPASAPRSLSPGAWPAAASPSARRTSLSGKATGGAAHLRVAPVLAPGQLRATPLAWVLRLVQRVLDLVLGNLLTMTLGTFILAGIALTRGSTWLVGVLLAPVCRVAGRVQVGAGTGTGKPAAVGVVGRAFNGTNRRGKVARMFLPLGVFRRWRQDSAAAVSIDGPPPDGPGVEHRGTEQALAH